MTLKVSIHIQDGDKRVDRSATVEDFKPCPPDTLPQEDQIRLAVKAIADALMRVNVDNPAQFSALAAQGPLHLSLSMRNHEPNPKIQ